MEPKRVSVVIPVFNEISIVDELITRVDRALSAAVPDYEILLVDDGSTDGTLERIRARAADVPSLRYLSFSRNFGHQTAVSAGIEYASGQAVVVMDGDLQDPPEFIPAMIAKWREGWEVVYAVRRRRKENWMLRGSYYLFYRILAAISDVHVPADAGDFCLMDRKVADVVRSLPERNRFVRGLRAWAGFRQTGLEYEREKRGGGESKYPLKKLVKLAFDGFLSFSAFPLRFCGMLGFAMAGLSLLGFLLAIFWKLFFQDVLPLGWTSLIASLFFIGGVQLMMLSMVGAYIGRIYTEVQRRPLFILKEASSSLRAAADEGAPLSRSPR